MFTASAAQEWKRKNERFRIFMRTTETHPLSQRLALSDLMPIPWTRLTKYKLLIDNVCNSYKKHWDRLDGGSCLSSVYIIFMSLFLSPSLSLNSSLLCFTVCCCCCCCCCCCVFPSWFYCVLLLLLCFPQRLTRRKGARWRPPSPASRYEGMGACVCKTILLSMVLIFFTHP